MLNVLLMSLSLLANADVAESSKAYELSQAVRWMQSVLASQANWDGLRTQLNLHLGFEELNGECSQMGADFHLKPVQGVYDKLESHVDEVFYQAKEYQVATTLEIQSAQRELRLAMGRLKQAFLRYGSAQVCESFSVPEYLDGLWVTAIRFNDGTKVLVEFVVTD